MISNLKEPIAGANAGVLGTVLGFPLDSLKVRMQITHKSMLQSAKLIYSDGGVMNFYRGVASPLVALTILNTLNFSTYNHFSRMLIGGPVKLTNNQFEWRVGLAAACVGPLSSCISTPFELVKTQMQLNSKNTGPSESHVQFKNSLHATTYISRTMGPLALFKGYGVNTVREMVFLGTYFTVYEHLKHRMHRTQLLPPSVSVALSGGMAGSIGWFISFPLDGIKAHIQGMSLFVKEAQPSSMNVMRRLLKTRGVMGLYSGVLPSILRAFLVSSSRFSAYEGTLWLIDQSFPTEC